jgi:probable HAF family extracellular repeat protein
MGGVPTIMKIIRGFKVRGFILASAFSAGLCFGTSASAQERSYLIDLNSKTVTDIGTLGGTSTGTYTLAHGINDAGQVVGTAGGPRAFITGPDGMGMRDLGTLGGSISSPSAINEAGQVVGTSVTAESLVDHAFITGPDGVGMRDLGTLGGSTSAFGINDAGQVVGLSLTAGGSYPFTHAFVTGPNGVGMMDLNSLVNLPEGVLLTEARDINNSGQVVAIGLIPEPEIYALFLAGLGLIGFMARRKKTG